MLNSLQNGRSSLIFTTLLEYITTYTIITKNSFVHFTQFSSHYSLFCLLIKPSFQSPVTLSFSIPQQFLASLFLRTAIPTIPTTIAFSLPQPFSQYRLCRGTNEQGSLLTIGFVLISLSFLEV